MKARLHSVRIAPKKANLIAAMIRGMPVEAALMSLGKTHKKAARILEKLLASAIANAKQNDRQSASNLIVKYLIVNKAQAYHRGIPMARGRVRPIRKFMSHIEITLGILGEIPSQRAKSTDKITKKKASGASSASKSSSSKK